jgi:tetratricopeptide (TPR) repeat protein
VLNLNAQTIEVEKAKATINEIISHSERYFKQGELNLKDNRLEQAMSDFDKAIEVFLFSSTSVTGNQRLKESYLQLIDKIYLLEMSAKNKSARNKISDMADLSNCLRTDETNKTVIELLIQALNSYKAQDYESSVSLLRRVLASEPMQPLAYLLMGKIHLKRDDSEQAISSFKTALFWDSSLVEAYLSVARIYFVKGDLRQAENYLRNASQIEPDNPKVKALSRLINKQADENDEKIIDRDAAEIEVWLNELVAQKIVNPAKDRALRNLIFVAPFQSGNSSNPLGQDFSYVLSNLLAVPTFCVVGYDKNKNLFESFGIEPGESFTLATAIKIATAAGANVLVTGRYRINRGYSRNDFNTVSVSMRLIKINEGRFLSEQLSDGRRVMREIVVEDDAKNLRTLQGQIAYQVLYQLENLLPYSQNEFIKKAYNVEIPKRLKDLLGFDSTNSGELDFSIYNSLKRTNCSENVLNNLQLRGFKLGMTFNEVLKTMPKAPIKNISSSEKQLSVSPKTSLTKEARFKDIDSIQLNFFDNYLYSIGIVYDDAVKWNGVDEFSNLVEKTLNLPKIKRGDYEFDGNYLFCGNYQLKIMFANNKTPAIHLFDTTVFGKIQQRKKEEQNKILLKKIEEEKRKRQEEEEKKKVFKP